MQANYSGAMSPVEYVPEARVRERMAEHFEQGADEVRVWRLRGAGYTRAKAGQRNKNRARMAKQAKKANRK